MKNIILIGMMSSGKTTLGKRLAKYLDYKFIDLDKLIEQSESSDIPTIFAQKGEAYFREVESRILKETIPNNRLVIASGGGAPCFFDNMDFIKKNGISIFLDVPAAELAKRIHHHGKDDRPILSGASSVEAALSQKIEERRVFYAQADITLKGSIQVDDLIQSISSFL